MSEWTVLGVVTRLPERNRSTEAVVDTSNLVRQSGSINRQAFEDIALQLLVAPDYRRLCPLDPVGLRDGVRLFSERGQTHALTLVASRSTPSSVTRSAVVEEASMAEAARR